MAKTSPLAFLAFLAFLAGCAAPQKPVRVARTIDAQGLLAELRANFSSVQALKLSASILYTPPDEEPETLKTITAYSRPRNLRIRGYKAYTTTLFDFLLTGDRWMLYLPGEGRALAGSMDRLPRLGGPWHSVALVTASLLGESFDASPQVTGLVKSRREWLLELSHPAPGGASYITRLAFPPADPRFTREIFMNSSGSVLAEVSFRDYKNYGALWFPRKWDIIVSATQEQLAVSVGSLDLDPELSQGIFSMNLPPRIEVEEVQ